MEDTTMERSFLVIYRPDILGSTVNEMRVIGAFASNMTLAKARDLVRINRKEYRTYADQEVRRASDSPRDLQ